MNMLAKLSFCITAAGLLLAGGGRAAAQPHIVGIAGPVVDPDFGAFVRVDAQQLKNKKAAIEAASSHTFSDAYVGAFYDCAEEAQVVVALFPVGVPWDFTVFRARNDPCNGNALPEMAGEPEPMTPFERAYRFTRAGIEYRLQSLPAPLVPRFDGVRRFIAVPVSPVAP